MDEQGDIGSPHARTGSAAAGDGDDAPGIEAPAAVGRDERRLQVRAYNLWAGLLRDRAFPAPGDLDLAALPDFAANSVLLDLSATGSSPAIRFLGQRLAAECGIAGTVGTLGEVPPGSVLALVAEHCPRVLANRAPVGFDAEFVNQRGRTILSRGILLPFASDGVTIDAAFVVVSWKEAADRPTTAALQREMAGALDAPSRSVRREDPITVWADGPAGQDQGAAEAEPAGDPANLSAPWPADLEHLRGGAEVPRATRQLRALNPAALAALRRGDGEFALLLARRLPSGKVVLLGEVPEDRVLLERAARRLLAHDPL